jgi:hypothetical protein
MKHVYLDSSDDVIAQSTVPRTLEEAQAKNALIVAVIPDAPDEVVAKSMEPTVSYYHRLTSGDGTDISHYTEVHDLTGYGSLKIAEINQRTDELLTMGFLYDGHRFPLTSAYAATYIGLTVVDQRNAIAFPVHLKDMHNGVYAVPDKTTLKTILASAAAGIMEIQDGETQLRNALNAATTKEEIDAIVDTREPLNEPSTTAVGVADYISQTEYVEEDDHETSTTATSPNKRLVLSVSNLPANNKWRLEWSLEFKSERSTRIAYAAVYVDDQEIAVDHIKSDEWRVAVGAKELTLAGDHHEFLIAYWSNHKNYAASIRRLSLRLIRKNEV